MIVTDKNEKIGRNKMQKQLSCLENTGDKEHDCFKRLDKALKAQKEN